MMNCPYFPTCGGCVFRDLNVEDYRNKKNENFRYLLEKLSSKDFKFGDSVFIDDNNRRRATFAFEYSHKKISLGFNKSSSHQIIDINSCLLLTDRINKIIPSLKLFLTKLCSQSFTIKSGKKNILYQVTKGDIAVCEADNGVDVVLEYDAPVNLDARMLIAELVQNNQDIIRISHRKNNIDTQVETILQKALPCIQIGKYKIPLPAGGFLQASKKSEKALADLVLQYLQGFEGKIADLFCGMGNFSYYLAANLPKVQITAVDSNSDSLKIFKEAVNTNQISNVEIKKQNLFKYPMMADEISQFQAIVFDPPRAGAKEQCKQIALSPTKPKIIIAVSCNPVTFINDANILLSSGYKLKEVTMVDQFVYSNHSELVACFTNNNS